MRDVFSILACSVVLSLSADAGAQTVPPAAPEPTAEPAGPTWRATVHMRPRTEFLYNRLFNLDPAVARYKRSDNYDSLSLRSRVGLDMDGDNLDASVQLQYASIWGATGGDELTDPALGVHQAFVKWTPVDWWWLQVGRSEVVYGDHRVLGNVGWSQIGRAWDGVRSGFVFADKIGLDLLALWYQDGLLNGAAAFDGRVLEDDAFLSGAYFHSKDLSEFFTDLDVYALADVQFDQVARAPQRQILGTFGARARAAVKPAALVVEGAYQAGERCVPVAPTDPRLPPTLECEDTTVAVSAGFVDSEVTVALGPVTPFIGFGMATGDSPDTSTNEGYFHMYPTAHKFLGLMDVVGARTNVREARIGAELKLGKLKLRESVHHFTALQPTETAVGVEIDTTAVYPILDGFAVQAGHAVFVPFDGVSLDGSDPSGVASWWFLQLTFDAGIVL